MLLRHHAFLLLPLASGWSLASAQSTEGTTNEERVDKALNKVLKPVAVATDVAVDVATKTTQYVSDKWDSRPTQMREILDLRLPGNLEKYNFTLDFEPRIGDALRREYVRFPIELRYGFTDRWEGYLGLTPYTPNPFRSSHSGWGLGYVTNGLRYDLHKNGRKWGFDQITVGAELRVPLGRPPIRMIDHYSHLVPYISASRRLSVLPHTTFLTQISFDSAQVWGNTIPAGVPERDIFEVMPALLYKPGELGYFGQFAGRHIQHDGESRLGSLSRLGLVWDIPNERSVRWGLKGKWQVETAVEVETEEKRKNDFGLTTRVRWKFDLKSHRPVK